MGVSGHIDAPAALPPGNSPVPIVGESGLDFKAGLYGNGKEKISYQPRGSNLEPSTRRDFLSPPPFRENVGL